MPSTPVLLWFREDFRLADNAALSAAVRDDTPVLCVFVFDKHHKPGSAACWWLDGALLALDASLKKRGGTLHVLNGDPCVLIPTLAREITASAVHWNRRYDPAGRTIDTTIKSTLKNIGIPAHSFPGSLLHEPWSVRTKADTPFQVFTPFWRAARDLPEPRPPLPTPDALSFAAFPEKMAASRVDIDALDLRPRKPDWADGFRKTWDVGEEAAHIALNDFMDGALAGYAEKRDYPASETTSRLSPYLRFGHVTPAQLWHAAQAVPASDEDRSRFLSELGWREFAWSILFERADLSTRNIRTEFDALPWRDDPKGFAAWRKGKTGYPLVDAGMRELWHTGWMHNRVRMVVASFLVKHLLIDWRLGEQWFTDTLVDHDPASNPMNWQWNAGTGVDAAPFFRIMSPILQSEKFDPEGNYIRRWVPELRRVPAKVIHTPWTADTKALEVCGVVLGRDYPEPIVDHKMARDRALSTWKNLRNA